jgi:hypothetical protein
VLLDASSLSSCRVRHPQASEIQARLKTRSAARSIDSLSKRRKSLFLDCADMAAAASSRAF